MVLLFPKRLNLFLRSSRFDDKQVHGKPYRKRITCTRELIDYRIRKKVKTRLIGDVPHEKARLGKQALRLPCGFSDQPWDWDFS